MNAPIQLAANQQKNGARFSLRFSSSVGRAGGPSGDSNYVPGVGKVNRDTSAVRYDLSHGPLGATAGSPGAVTNGGRLAGGLGATSGTGTLTQGGRLNGGVGASSNTGTISSGGRIPGGVGGVSGGVSAIPQGPRPGTGGLGATNGNPGAISQGGRPPGGLGATSGNSGAVTRPPNGGLILGGLGQTAGNPGAIGSGGRIEGGLGAIAGDPGAITHGGGRINGLYGEFGGSPGAVSHTGGRINGLGAVSGNSGAINRGVGGSTGLRGGSRPVGRVSRMPKEIKKPKPANACCGRPYSGKMTLVVDYTFDKWGNEVAPKVLAWNATVDDSPWTPPNWEDYLDLPGITTTEEDLTTSFEYGNETFGQCLSVEMDEPDPEGALVSRVTSFAASAQEVRLRAERGKTTSAARAGLTP